MSEKPPADNRFQVVKGYIRFTHMESGKVLQEGGFIESSQGRLWGILDTQTDTIVKARTNEEEASQIAGGLNRA